MAEFHVCVLSRCECFAEYCRCGWVLCPVYAGLEPEFEGQGVEYFMGYFASCGGRLHKMLLGLGVMC